MPPLLSQFCLRAVAQFNCASAAVALIYPPGARPPLKLYLESCSVVEHVSGDRRTPQDILERVRRGDLLLLASPDRAFRDGSEMRQFCAEVGAHGCAVAVAAVDRHAPWPLTLLEAGGQLAGHHNEAALLTLTEAVLGAVCALLDTAGHEHAVQQGVYVGQHAVMSRCINAAAGQASGAGSEEAEVAAGGAAVGPAAAAPQPQPSLPPGGLGAVQRLLHCLTRGADVLAYARTSQVLEMGSASDLTGSAGDRQLSSHSLVRQEAFLAKFVSDEASSFECVVREGLSISDSRCGSGSSGECLASQCSSGALTGKLVLVTSIDRLCRSLARFEGLRRALQAQQPIPGQPYTRVVVLLLDSELLDALAPEYTARALGQLCSSLDPQLLQMGCVGLTVLGFGAGLESGFVACACRATCRVDVGCYA